MFDRTSPLTHKQTEKKQESQNPKPKRSFKEVLGELHKRSPFNPSQRKESVFDLSARNKKKANKEHAPAQTVEQPKPITDRHASKTEELSSISELSAVSRELIEKLVDAIILESKNGISTTTVMIETENPNSMFNGTTVMINHYDTAPHSFHIQLSGSPEAMNELSPYLPSLHTQLTERLDGFVIDLLPPALSQDKPTKVNQIKRAEEKKTQIKKIPS